MVVEGYSPFHPEAYLTLASEADIPQTEKAFNALLNQSGISDDKYHNLKDVFFIDGRFAAPTNLPQYYDLVKSVFPKFKSPLDRTAATVSRHARRFDISNTPAGIKPEDLNTMDVARYEKLFFNHPHFTQRWLEAQDIGTLRDVHGKFGAPELPLTAENLSTLELDDFRAILIENHYLQPTETDNVVNMEWTGEVTQSQFELQPATFRPERIKFRPAVINGYISSTPSSLELGPIGMGNGRTEIVKMTAPLLKSFEGSRAGMSKLLGASNSSGLDDLMLREFALYLAGAVADENYPGMNQLHKRNLRHAMVPLDQAHGGVNAGMLAQGFGHATSQLNLRALISEYGGIDIKNGFDSIVGIPQALLDVASSLLKNSSDLKTKLLGIQQGSYQQDFRQTFQRTADNMGHTIELLETLTFNTRIHDDEDAVLECLDYFPNEEAQTYLWSRLGVDNRLFHFTKKPPGVSQEQWLLVQHWKQKIAHRQHSQTVEAGVHIIMMAAFAAAAVFCPPLGFILGGSGLLMSSVELEGHAEVLGVTKNALASDSNQTTQARDNNGTRATLATQEDVYAAQDRMEATAARIPLELALMLAGLNVAGEANEAIEIGTMSERLAAGYVPEEIITMSEKLATRYGGTTEMWSDALKLGVSAADGTGQGAILPTFNSDNWESPETLAMAVRTGALFGLAGGVLGHIGGMSGQKLHGNYRQNPNDITLTLEGQNGKNLKLVIPRKDIKWTTQNKEGVYTDSSGKKYSLKFDPKNKRFEITLKETPDTIPAVATAAKTRARGANEDGTFDKFEDAHDEATRLVKDTKKEYSVIRDWNGKRHVIEGTEKEAVASLYRNAGEQAALGEARFFGFELEAHFHPPGESPLPSHNDMMTLAQQVADAARKGNYIGLSLTTKVTGFIGDDNEVVTTTLTATYANGKVSLKMEAPPGVRQHSDFARAEKDRLAVPSDPDVESILTGKEYKARQAVTAGLLTPEVAAENNYNSCLKIINDDPGYQPLKTNNAQSLAVIRASDAPFKEKATLYKDIIAINADNDIPLGSRTIEISKVITEFQKRQPRVAEGPVASPLPPNPPRPVIRFDGGAAANAQAPRGASPEAPVVVTPRRGAAEPGFLRRADDAINGAFAAAGEAIGNGVNAGLNVFRSKPPSLETLVETWAQKNHNIPLNKYSEYSPSMRTIELGKVDKIVFKYKGAKLVIELTVGKSTREIKPGDRFRLSDGTEEICPDIPGIFTRQGIKEGKIVNHPGVTIVDDLPLAGYIPQPKNSDCEFVAIGNTIIAAFKENGIPYNPKQLAAFERYCYRKYLKGRENIVLKPGQHRGHASTPNAHNMNNEILAENGLDLSTSMSSRAAKANDNEAREAFFSDIESGALSQRDLSVGNRFVTFSTRSNLKLPGTIADHALAVESIDSHNVTLIDTLNEEGTLTRITMTRAGFNTVMDGMEDPNALLTWVSFGFTNKAGQNLSLRYVAEKLQSVDWVSKLRDEFGE